MSDVNQEKGATPKYKLTERAYIDDALLEAGAEIEYVGVPGHHMEPVNDAAKAMVKKHPHKFVDPILQMTAVN
jgi:hypothetical protein